MLSLPRLFDVSSNVSLSLPVLPRPLFSSAPATLFPPRTPCISLRTINVLACVVYYAT
jgi:hypothetical protein